MDAGVFSRRLGRGMIGVVMLTAVNLMSPGVQAAGMPAGRLVSGELSAMRLPGGPLDQARSQNLSSLFAGVVPPYLPSPDEERFPGWTRPSDASLELRDWVTELLQPYSSSGELPRGQVPLWMLPSEASREFSQWVDEISPQKDLAGRWLREAFGHFRQWLSEQGVLPKPLDAILSRENMRTMLLWASAFRRFWGPGSEHRRLTKPEKQELWGIGEIRVDTTGGSCKASYSEAPCAAMGVASLDRKNGPTVAEGNPVNPLTGRKYQVELDAAPADGVLGLEIRRHYSSGLGVVANPVGRGWMLSYDTRLYAVGNSVQIIQADGQRLIFRRPVSAGDTAPGVLAGVSSAAMSVMASRRLPLAWGGAPAPQMCVSPALDKALLRAVLAPRETPAPVCAGQVQEDGEVLLLDHGYRWRWPSGRELDFDAAGFLVSIREPKRVTGMVAPMPSVRVMATPSSTSGLSAGEDAHWHVLRIRRNRSGQITQVIDPAGRSMQLRYDAQGHLMAIDHPRGRWLYQVSATGQLLAVQSPTRARRLYRYEDPGFPSALTAIELKVPGSGRNLRVGRWHYDREGRVVEYRGQRGHLRFEYRPEDAVGVAETVVRDADGQEKRWRYRQVAGQWQVLSVTGRDCVHCGPGDRYFRYDGQGRLAGLRDQIDLPDVSLSRMLRFVHDEQGRIVRVYRRHWQKTPSAGATPPAAGEDDLRLFRRYEYADAGSRLPSLMAGPSVEPGREYTVRFEYAQAGGRLQPVRLTESGYSHGRRQQRSVQIAYDEHGRIRRIDGPLPGDEDRIDFEPFKDAGGNTLYRLVDGLGRELLPARRMGWLTDSLRWVQDSGRFQAEVGALRHEAANGVRQRVVIDDFGRITRSESPDAGIETFWHDLADRVVRQTDSAGGEVHIDHDAHGRPLLRRVSGPNGFVEETRYRYQGQQLVEVKHPVVTEHYRHDEQGRLLERQVEVHPGAGTVRQRFVTRYRYQPGQILPAEVVLPNGAVIRQQVDASWHTVSLVGDEADGPGVPLYRREIRPRKVDNDVREEQWLFGNGTRRHLWWAAGDRLLGVMDDAMAFSSADAMVRTPGRLLSAEMLDHGADGRIQAILTPTHLQRLAYDSRGRLIIAEEHPLPGQGQAMRVARAHVGPDGTGTGKADTVARIPQADAGEAPAWWYAYDENGNRVFSGRYQPDGLASRRAPAAHDSGEAGRSDAGSGLPTWSGSGAGSAADTGARKGKAILPEPVAALDAQVDGVAASYQPGSNRLQGTSYDAAGRPLQWQGWQIDWHPGGQMARMRHADGRVLDYFYNHRGERVARQDNGRWFFYDYDDGRLLAEKDDAAAAMRAWWYEGEVPVMVISGGSGEAAVAAQGLGQRIWRWLGLGNMPQYRLNWLHVSHLGLPLAMSDAQGQVVWHQRFGPFGERMENHPVTGHAVRGGEGEAPHGAVARERENSQSANDPLLRFPGQWEDPATGLYYNLLRDYDPATGRYLSPDPLGLRAGPNPYLYVNGDPVRHVDPTGLLLFAFDGTHNAVDQDTNIWKFSLLYDHAANGAPTAGQHDPYLNGVGVTTGPHMPYDPPSQTVSRDAMEGLTADGWKDNVEYHIQQFRAAVNALKPGETLPIDVVGFSRGAVQALEFGRLVVNELKSGRLANASQVQLRFMGLLDPVATNMFDTEGWEKACKPMSIDDEWQSVVNILATGDRRDPHFNALSMGSQASQQRAGVKREEFALLGAHSDIGGGYADSDFSNVALWALLERAQEAGVRFRAERPDNIFKVHRPLAHVEQWIWNLGGEERKLLVDGNWVGASGAGVPGMSATADQTGLQKEHNFSWSGLFSKVGQLLGGREMGPSNEVVEQYQEDLDTIVSALRLEPVSRRLVDMQKYCAYLLAHRFLKRCPY